MWDRAPPAGPVSQGSVALQWVESPLSKPSAKRTGSQRGSTSSAWA
jgi:hypothetical protein